MESAAGLQRLSLQTLNSKISNAVVVGIIIRSQGVRIFTGKNDNAQKGVWNFTIRDSITDYINCTFWGSDGFITHLAQKFLVGDVVDIMTPKIVVRHIDDSGEQYRPSVTSPFSLTLNEESSSMIVHEGDNYHDYLPLVHYPTKPASSHLTLADVCINGSTIKGEFVDLLVAIQYISPTKKLKLKSDGSEKDKKDISVLDQTHNGMKITLWDTEFIQRAENWKSRETVLFLADMRVEWSDFHKTMVAVANSKTIITEDPLIPEAEVLRQYARTVPINKHAILEHMTSSAPDPSTINTVMTCKRVSDIADVPTTIANYNQREFTALLYVYVTELDLDGFGTLVVTRCERCGYRISRTTVNVCVNLNCPVGSGAEEGSPETKFSIRVLLSDHTGSIICKLAGAIAEKVLGCTVEEFLKMTDREKELLKWKYLLERCKVKIIVLKRENAEPLISILTCEVAKIAEVAAMLPVY